MEISTTFTILLPADEAYRFLLDLEQVAPCVPGGELGPAAADGTYPANVTVRLAGWEAQAAAAPQISGVKLLLHVVAERLGRIGRKGER